MRKILFPAAAMLLSSACVLSPQADRLDVATAGTVPPSAERLEMPSIKWDNTGRDGWFYHHVGGDCDYLLHGHGRNNAWGLWRMPAERVSADAVVPAAEGVAVAFTCTDGSACIEAGALDETPGRVQTHSIPFQTRERADRYLQDVASLRAACAARR
ncbi:MAG: hypothetical protein ACK4HR_04780 [Hyphomonas sp.]|jgi:hypothetical protein